MARVSWSFNFTAGPALDAKDEFESACADARAKAAAWTREKLPLLGFSPTAAAAVAADVTEGVEVATAFAKRKGFTARTVTRDKQTVRESFFVELSGRAGPDANSRHGAALGVFVSEPLPT
jgi:hypothetical protein